MRWCQNQSMRKGSRPVDLGSFIVGRLLPDRRAAPRESHAPAGSAPILYDRRISPSEIVGEFLGSTPTRGDPFGTSGVITECPCLHRSASHHLRRQAANLWKAQGAPLPRVLALTPHDSYLALVDSMPLPACLFARAYRCHRFKGEPPSARTPSSSRPSTASGCICGCAGRDHYPLLGRSCKRSRAFRAPRTPSSPLAASPSGIAITARLRGGRARQEHGRRAARTHRTKKRDPAPQRSA